MPDDVHRVRGRRAGRRAGVCGVHARRRSRLRGALGIDKTVRNGFRQIRVTFNVKANAPEEKIREVVERAKARSSVFDSVTRGVPVAVEVAA
jgi:hypothetical protein